MITLETASGESVSVPVKPETYPGLAAISTFIATSCLPCMGTPSIEIINFLRNLQIAVP